MASTAAATSAVVVAKPRKVAGVIISGHGFQHMYADGFLVLLPLIRDAFGLDAISLGILSTARQAAGGFLSMGGGFIVDMFSGKRGLFLGGSLFAMALAYLVAGAAPNFAVLVVGVSLGSAAGSFWHPVGLGILSYTFPGNRALMMSLHRSSGSLGETVTPPIVAAALLVTSWRGVLVGGFFVIAVVSLGIIVTLARLGLPERRAQQRGAGQQIRTIGSLFRDKALPVLLAVSGLRGMADRAVVFFLPLVVAQLLREGNPNVSDERIAFVAGAYLALMSGASIVISPLIGAFSDRVGRKPVLIAVLAFSAVVTGLLSAVSDIGIAFTALIGALGIVRFAGANMAQAASLDIAEGKRIEGSMIGLLWGNNALFGAFSPLLLGFVIAFFSPPGTEDFRLIFPYATVIAALATIAALFLPPIGRPAARAA